MVSLVLEHLKDLASQEYIFLTSEILTLLDNNGYETHTDSYDDLVYSFESNESLTFIDALEAKHKLVLTSVCADFGITTNDEAKTRELFKLVEGLLSIETYDNKEAIINVCDGDYDLVEKIATILSYVTSEQPEFFMVTINHINESIITKIKEINTEDKPMVDNVENAVYLNNVNKFCTLVGNKESLIVKELINGLNVGFKMEVYLEFIGSKLNNLEASQIAQELLCISVISSDTQKQPLTSIRTILPKYVHDELKYTAIDKEFNRLLLEYTK